MALENALGNRFEINVLPSRVSRNNRGVTRGVPEYIRSDNGSEFAAEVVRKWLSHVSAKSLCIEPGSSLGERARGILQWKLADE